jgi:hypothetical protein
MMRTPSSWFSAEGEGRVDLRAIGVRGWLLIAGALTLGAGTSLGVLASTYIVHGSRPRESFEERRPGVGRILDITNPKAYDLLGLSEPQRRQVDRILGDHFLRLVKIRQEREALVRKLEGDLTALLDETQRERMQEIKWQVKYSETVDAVLSKVSTYKLDLDLTPEQEEKVYTIFLADQIKKDEVLKDRSLSGDEKRKRYLLLSDERAAKLRPVLGEEQWKRFRAIEEKKRSFMNGRSSFRGPPCEAAPAGAPAGQQGGPAAVRLSAPRQEASRR